jgi:hypothetical protein
MKAIFSEFLKCRLLGFGLILSIYLLPPGVRKTSLMIFYFISGVIYACITVQAYLHYSYITATLRLHYDYIAAAFLNCGCITCISVQQNFEVLTPRFYRILNKNALETQGSTTELYRHRIYCEGKYTGEKINIFLPGTRTILIQIKNCTTYCLSDCDFLSKNTHL